MEQGHAVADAIEARSTELVAAESQNTGKPLGLTASEELPPAIDHLRRTATREQSLIMGPENDQYDLPVESGRLSPEQESERKERRGEIESVVRALPGNYRELIILRHSQDLSYEEIVEVTGLPLGTVKNRLFRAREMMRQQFVEKGITGIQ